jgi:hypothetical protein
MSPQIHKTEVSSEMPSKEFINIDLPWYRENICIFTPQPTHPLGSVPGGGLTYWTTRSHFHINWPDPIQVVLYPSIDKILQIDMTDTLTNALGNFIAQKFIDIPGVEYVLLSLENDSVDIWTVINKLDREIREKIYDVEFDILGIISNFHFDFHVICRNDRNIEELYPSNAKMVFQK